MVPSENLPSDGGGNSRYSSLQAAFGEIHSPGAEETEGESKQDSTEPSPSDSDGGGSSGCHQVTRATYEATLRTGLVQRLGGEEALNKLMDDLLPMILNHKNEAVILLTMKDKELIFMRDLEATKAKVRLDTVLMMEAFLMDAFADGFIVVHSHTEGTAEPSNDDLKTTCVLSWLADLMGVELVDHWIISKTGCFHSLDAGPFRAALKPDVHFRFDADSEEAEKLKE